LSPARKGPSFDVEAITQLHQRTAMVQLPNVWEDT